MLTSDQKAMSPADASASDMVMGDKKLIYSITQIQYSVHPKLNHCPRDEREKARMVIEVAPNWEPQTTSIKELFDHINLGRGIASIFKDGYRTKDNFECAQFIALDFDDGPNVQTLAQHDFMRQHVCIVGPSPSSMPEAPRTRVVIPLSVPISDFSYFTRLANIVLFHFENLNPDMTSAQGERFIFGCQEGKAILTGESVLCVDDILAMPEPAPIKEPEYYAHTRTHGDSLNEGLPGSDYNERGDFASVLKSVGWQYVRRVGEKDYWRRPGKNYGISATFDYGGSNLFYCFTSSSEHFKAQKSYSPWAVYTYIRHAGDFKASAKALGQAGYGNQNAVQQYLSRPTPSNASGENGSSSPEVIRDEPESILTTIETTNGLEQAQNVQRLVEVLARNDANPVEIQFYAKQCAKLKASTVGAIKEAVKDTRREIKRTNAERARVIFSVEADGRPVLYSTDKDLQQITQKCWDVLRESNTPPQWFRFGGFPAWIEKDDLGNPVVRLLNEDRLRHIMADIAQWVKVTDHGEKPDYPPLPVIKNMLATPNIDLPRLVGIVTAPFLTPSGELQTTPGYNEESGLYYAPADGFTFDLPADIPTQEDVEQAVSVVYELIQDFPFVSDGERAHTIALMLLPFLRPSFEGHTPLHLFEKTTPGTGGTLLANVALYPALGKIINPMVEGQGEDEWRKRITSTLRSAPPALLIDNLRKRLDSSALSSALTATTWEDRLLGSSDNIMLPIRCAWVATGNNPSLSLEIARRTIRIRLDAQTPKPWLRGDFKMELPQWIVSNRSEVVSALLIIIRSWVSKGRPLGNKKLGHFEPWSHNVGGVLEAARIPGFLTNLDDFYDSSDDESSEWGTLCIIWWESYGDRLVGTKDVYNLIQRNDVGVWLGSKIQEHSQKITLGKELKKQRNRRFAVFIDGIECELEIIQAGKKRRASQWCVRKH